MDALNQSLSSRRRGSVLADLAALGIRQRDIDKILNYANSAIELGQRTKSGYVGRKIQALKPHLAPMLAEGRIVQLDQEITSLAYAGYR